MQFIITDIRREKASGAWQEGGAGKRAGQGKLRDPSLLRSLTSVAAKKKETKKCLKYGSSRISFAY